MNSGCGTGGSRGGICPPPLFRAGATNAKCPPPTFLTWDILIGVRMPTDSQIFKIKWFRLPQIALLNA